MWKLGGGGRRRGAWQGARGGRHPWGVDVFKTFIVLWEQSLTFLAESESDVFTKSEFLMLVFWWWYLFCWDQSVIRYHVIRAEAETCYGYLVVENNNTKRTFVFWEGLGKYKRDIILFHSWSPNSTCFHLDLYLLSWRWWPLWSGGTLYQWSLKPEKANLDRCLFKISVSCT